MSLMKENPYKPYTGESLKEAQILRDGERISAYFPGEKLLRAVEMARLLKRPLLLRGEPGCGKTRLAQAIAFDLYGEKYKDYFHEWHIKSTSQAKDGLYSFDSLLRLRDAYAKEPDIDLTKYRKLGPLGSAINESTFEEPHVLLIDEIDKGDIDFPNDLLLELDEKRFFIPETKETFPKTPDRYHPPIIIITSNDEKELPNAFLRRCIFHYIEFPDKKDLERIINSKLKEEDIHPKLPTKVTSDLIAKFKDLREDMKNNSSSGVIPSTSSLIDWFLAIHFGLYEKKSEDANDLEELLKENKEKLPYIEVLLKNREDSRFLKKP